jgi:hypothetical protein
VQGFLLSRPLAEMAVMRLLEAEAAHTGPRARRSEDAVLWEPEAKRKSVLLANNQRPDLSEAIL